MHKVICRGCEKEFLAKNKTRAYCNSRCQRDSKFKLFQENSHRTVFMGDSIPDGTVGAIHELVVSVDLMRKGFHVFRAQSPACPCDLICLGNEKTMRVEVKTGRWKLNGSLVYSSVKNTTDRFDVLAVVLYDGSIVYHDSNLKIIDIQAVRTDKENEL